ncbi:hypothetical protein [Hymenobacter lapidarius]|uniref:hypothetical protein n=1 Tax=Hymenobacter lapidarius TaxID=1908237 RepID=UPI0008A29008|nr:hypothetical protein [Hymenobacter lapidarius]
MLIRARLTLRFTLLVLLIQLLFAGFVSWLFATAREQRFAGQLQAEAGLSARLLVRQQQLNPAYLRAFRPRDVPGVAAEQLSVFGPDGRLLYTSADAQSLRLHRAQRPNVQSGQSVRFQDATARRWALPSATRVAPTPCLPAAWTWKASSCSTGCA